MNKASAWLSVLISVCVWVAAAVPVPGETVYTKPVITAAIPAQVQVTSAPGELYMELHGHDFTIPGNNHILDSRDIRLFVRHSAKGGPWQCLYNNVRSSDYYNPPREFGKCNYGNSTNVQVWLSRQIWLSREGTLQFLLIKGKCSGAEADDWTEKARSNVFDVPVRADVTGVTRIDSLVPESFYVDQKNVSKIRVNGRFDFGTALLIDNVECKTLGAYPASGQFVAELPPGILNRQALHQVRLRDSQGTLSNVKTFWVYGPPRIVRIDPGELREKMGKITLKVRYGGLKPWKVQGRVDLLEGPGACPHPPPVSWEDMTVVFPGAERLHIELDGRWTRCPGTLHLWLVSKAGDGRKSITIVKQTPVVSMKPPAKFSKSPVSVHLPALMSGLRPQLKGLAHKVVARKPEAEIRRDFRAMLRKIVSETKGSPEVVRAAIANMQSELAKEIWEQERGKQEQITAAQRRHIQRLLDILKTMAENHARSVGQIRLLH